MENRLANTYKELEVSIFKKLLLTIKSSEFIIPMRKPLATMAGIMGTNISPKILIIYWNIFPCFAACFFNSSVLLAPILPSFINSSYTLLTSPVPKIICSCPCASNTPLTPSIFSRVFLSTLELSAITSLSLVAQCAALTILSAPPIACNTSFADF